MVAVTDVVDKPVRQRLVAILIRNGADVNAKDHQGTTCLMLAARLRLVDTIEQLFESVSSVSCCFFGNVVDRNGIQLRNG